MKYTPDFDFDSLPVLDADPSGISPSTEAAPMPGADGQAAPAQNASTPDFDFDSLPVLEEPVAQIQTMSPDDFNGQPNMGGATEPNSMVRIKMDDGRERFMDASQAAEFLRSPEYRQGAAKTIAENRARIEAGLPVDDSQGMLSTVAETALKGGLRAAGKIGGAFAGIATGPMRAVGMLFGRDNALVKGADWVDDKFDWFADDLGVGRKSGDGAADALASVGEVGSSMAAQLMPWLVGGGAASKIAGKALFAANVAGAGGRSATQMYDELKAAGADDETALSGARTAQAVSTTAAFVFGKLSVENYLTGIGAGAVSKAVANAVKPTGKGFEGIVKNVANGMMRRDIASRLVGGAEEFVTEGVESFVLNAIRQHGSGKEVDLEEALLEALPDAAIGAATGGVLAGVRLAEGRKGFRGVYEKAARAEVSQLMANMEAADIREINPKAFDAVAAKRANGGDVSRKDAEEIGLPTNWSKDQRNSVFDSWIAQNALADQFLEDRTTYRMRQEAEAAIRRTKMDEVQRGVLADEITALGIDAESKEYGGIWLNVANQISDAKELDDPVRRAELVQNALEKYVKENGELNVQFTTDDGATHERSWTYNPPKKETTDETRTDEAPAQPQQGAVGTGQAEAETPRPVEVGAQGSEETSTVEPVEPAVAPQNGDGQVPLDQASQKPTENAPTSAPSAEGAITQPKATESAEGGISQSDGTITPEEAAKERKKGKRIPKTAVKTEGTAPVAPTAVKPTKPVKANPKKAAAIVKDFAAKDDTRVTLKRIHHDHDSGLAVATDGRVLIATKYGYDPNYEDNPDAPYPKKWKDVILNYDKGTVTFKGKKEPIESIEIDPESVAKVCATAKRIARGIGVKDRAHVSIPFANGTRILMDADYMQKVAKAMSANGITEIKVPSKTAAAILAKNADTTIAAMPLRDSDSGKWGKAERGRGIDDSVVFDATTGKILYAPHRKNDEKYAKTEAEIDSLMDNGTKSAARSEASAPAVAESKQSKAAERINSIDDISDDDFSKPTRNVELPKLPKNVDEAIGANGKPVVIKQNIFEKNAAHHPELDGAASRSILKRSLYNPNLVGQSQPATKPNYRIAIQTGDRNAITILDVHQSKENIEVVGWRSINEKGFERLKRQAAREGGQFLILHPSEEGQPGALSGRPSGLTGDKVSNADQKVKAESAPKTPKSPKLTDDLKKRGIQAARILGVESGMDVPELEKTLKQVSKLDSPAAKRKAQALRDLIEYRKAVGQNTDPQSEESSGGKWRGESILSQNNMEDDAAPDGIRPADFAMADPKRAATAIRQNLPKVDEEASDPMNASLNPNALKDLSFVEWAKKKGRAITAKNRRAYDAEQVKAAVPILRRVFPGLKVTYHDTVQDPDAWHAKHPNGIQKLIIDQKSGRTLGWYSPDMKEVHLNPGATVETLAHEVLHAAQDWAKKNSPKLAAALEKIAKECPRDLKQKIIRTYKTADADTLLKEWGAFNFMGEGGKALRAELAKRENASWLKKFWNAVKDIWKDMMAKMGFNRMDLSAIDSMSAKDAMAYLARGMASGMTIGKVDAKNSPPTAKIDMTQKPSKMEWYKTTAFDYRAPLKWLRDEMAKRGVQFSDDSDFYQAARLVVGENQRAFNEAQRRMADYQKMLDETGIDHSDIVWYMQCLAAKDRNAMIKERNGKENGSGISDREAAEEISRMESEPNGAKYGEIAQFLQKMQREGLQFRVDSGLLDAETAQLWLDREPNHVPFRSAVDTESGEHIDWGNTQGQFNKNEFITAKGRQTFADDVVAWMFQEYLDAYTRGNENKLRGMIAEAIEISPSLGVGKVKSQEKILAHDFSAGNYKTTADGNGVTGDKAKQAVINNSNYRESRKNGDGGKRNVLAFKRGGKAYFIEFAEGAMGEKLQAAVNGRDLKKMPNAWNKLMRGWAATATSLSPTFAIRNGVADSINLLGNYIGDNGKIGGFKAYGNHLKNVKALSKAIHKYIRTGKIPDGEMGKWIDRYEKAGGLIAGMKREGYEDMSKRLALEFKGKKNKVAVVGSAIMNGIDYINRFSEFANRLAAFKTQVDMGKTDKQAALWSRESTVDFNMKGNVTGVTNALWMFSNSNLGASVRQIRALFKSKHGARLAEGLVGLGLLEGLAESLFNDDDEREKNGEGTGKDVSEYTRANSIYYRAGGTVLRFPFYAGPFSLLKYVGNCTARLLCRKMSISEFAKALGKEGLGALLNFLPFGNINFQSQSGTFADDVKTAVGTAVPSLIQPLAQGWGNVDYAGRSIYNEPFPGNEMPRSEQGRKGTASVWKWAAEALNEATREDGHLKGYVELTPEALKLAGESIGKNALRDAMGVVSVVNMALQNEDWNVRNIPAIRDFVRTTGGNDSRFYEARNEYRDNVNAYKKGNLTQTEKDAYLKRFPHVDNDWFKEADTEIRRYRKMEDGYAFDKGKAVPYERSKDELKEIREKRLKLQAEFIKRMGR